jgi:hypothetical protein
MFKDRRVDDPYKDARLAGTGHQDQGERSEKVNSGVWSDRLG